MAEIDSIASLLLR